MGWEWRVGDEWGKRVKGGTESRNGWRKIWQVDGGKLWKEMEEKAGKDGM